MAIRKENFQCDVGNERVNCLKSILFIFDELVGLLHCDFIGARNCSNSRPLLYTFYIIHIDSQLLDNIEAVERVSVAYNGFMLYYIFLFYNFVVFFKDSLQKNDRLHKG